MIDVAKEVMRALIVAALYLGIFGIAEFMRRRYPANTELSRKVIHLLGGLFALSFPYVFHSHWTVLALSLGFCGIVIISKKKHFFQSLHSVERRSFGGIYYPLAVYLIFYLGSDSPVIYCIAILVMTISDALAALVGSKYGKIRFDVEGNLKSLEGSITFFFIAFLCIHVPLLLATQTGRLESVVIAFIIALLVTGFEAISLSGSDNIIVPFGTYFLLSKLIHKPIEVIAWNLEILILIIAVTALIAVRPRLLKTSGLIGMILLNYAAISLCNFYWFLPLFLAQIMYYLLILFFIHYEGKEKVASFQVKVLFYIGIIPALLLFTANTVKDHMSVYLLYLVSITSQIAIICNYFFAHYVSRPFKADKYFIRHKKILEITCSVLATIFVAGLPIMWYGPKQRLVSMAMVVFGTWIAYVLNFMMNKYYRGVKDDIFEYRRRLVSALCGVTCVWIMQKFISF